MTSVAQLHRSRTTEPAAARGAPRPVTPSALRAPSEGSAPFIHLYAAPSAAAPTSSPAGQGLVIRDQGLREPRPRQVPDDAETTARISGIARSVAQGALEVLAGSRPLQQMARWLDPENYERLQLRSNLVRCINTVSSADRIGTTASAHRQVVVRSARVCPVSAGVYEASVVAFDQKRVRAVALRIELRRGTWRVTALEIG